MFTYSCQAEKKNKKTSSKKQQVKITFCTKVNFESCRLFEVPEDFDQSVALSDGVPMETYIIEYNVHDWVLFTFFLKWMKGNHSLLLVSVFHCLALATNCCRHYVCYEFPAKINPLFFARSFGTYSDESCAQTNSWAGPKLLFLSAMAV